MASNEAREALARQHCLVLGLEPYSGLPVHCLGIRTTLTLNTHHSSLRHPRADTRGASHSHAYSGRQSVLTNGPED